MPRNRNFRRFAADAGETKESMAQRLINGIKAMADSMEPGDRRKFAADMAEALEGTGSYLEDNPEYENGADTRKRRYGRDSDLPGGRFEAADSHRGRARDEFIHRGSPSEAEDRKYAMDSAIRRDFNQRFPAASKIKILG
jgi:hypothetical protein